MSGLQTEYGQFLGCTNRVHAELVKCFIRTLKDMLFYKDTQYFSKDTRKQTFLNKTPAIFNAKTLLKTIVITL